MNVKHKFVKGNEEGFVIAKLWFDGKLIANFQATAKPKPSKFTPSASPPIPNGFAFGGGG
jgi:hypothetical protein